MRAYLHDSEEFFFPENDSAQNLSVFYGTVAGYISMGRKISVDRSTEVLDINGKEIFENDKVQVVYLLTPDEISMGYNSVQVGYVEYDDGCWVITNNKDFYEYVGTTLIPQDKYRIKIIGTKYDKNKSNKL